MDLDARLSDKGRGTLRHALAQEGKVHIRLAEQYAAELDASGWSQDDTLELKANVATLEAAVGAQAEARDGASGAAVAGVQAVAQKACDGFDQVEGEIDAADAAQEAARRSASDHTLALYAVMGRLMEQIEDLNRAGKSAFHGDATTAARFNKDMLLRARRAGQKEKPGGAGEAGASAAG